MRWCLWRATLPREQEGRDSLLYIDLVLRDELPSLNGCTFPRSLSVLCLVPRLLTHSLAQARPVSL